MGVDVVLGEKLASVEDGVAVTETGRRIPSAVLVWCGGSHADPDAAQWDLASDTSGRLIATQDLKAIGHDSIYVVGDVAAFRDPADRKVLPMLAQFAIREAAHAADNILREARGEPTVDFEPNQHGEFVSVGPRWGVGWMFGLKVSGRFAIIMKRFTYIMYWLQVGSYRLAWRRTRQMLGMHR
jgi:NADH dehydrogenase